MALFASPDGGRELVQGDGRRLYFEAAGTDEAGRAIYRTGSAFEGTLVAAGVDGHRWELPDGRSLGFHGGYLVEIDWPDQRKLSVRYARGKLDSVTDETGRVLRFAYWPGAPGAGRALGGYDAQDFGTAPGQLASVTLPDGSGIAYEYDERSNLTRTTYPDGTHRRYHYEDETYRSHLTGLTDRTGVRYATWRYDKYGRAISSEHAGGVERVTLEHPEVKAIEAGQTVATVVTDSLGNESRYTWEQPVGGSPRLLESTGTGCASCPPTGMRWRYDAAGRLSEATITGKGTAVGTGTVSYAYDDTGRLAEVRRTTPDGTSVLVERRKYATATDLQPIRIARPSVNPDGERVTTFERDGDRLPVRIVERGFAPVLAMPGESGHREGAPDPIGYRPIERITTLAYDDRDRLVVIDGPRTDVEDVTRLSYDERSRLVELAAPSGPIVHLGGYDASGRLSSYRLGVQREVVLTRDGHGRIVRSRQGEHVNAFTYDADGRMTSASDSDGRTVRLRFDAADRVEAVTDDLGRTQTLEYDDESRVVGRSNLAADGALVHSLETVFDQRGLPSHITERRLDNRDRTDVRSVGIGTVDDTRTRTIDFTDASGIPGTQVQVDRLNRLTTLIAAGGERTSIGVDGFGRIARVTDSNSP